MRQCEVSFLLTKEEIKIIESVCYLEPFLEDNLQKIKRKEGKYRIKFHKEDLKDCFDAVSHASEFLTEYRERCKYHLLLERMKNYLNLTG